MPSRPPVLLDLDRTLVDLQTFTDYDAAWTEVRALVDPVLAEGGPATTWTSATRACMGVIASLRDEALWHQVSAVIASYERILDEETGSATRTNLLSIESMEAPDDYTVVLNLSVPDVPLLSALSSVNTVRAATTIPNGT